MKRFIKYILFSISVATAQTVSAEMPSLSSTDVMTTASSVADYFMTANPDVGAYSYVGGKKRNSRIWTRGVFYEGLLNLYREEPREEWLKYSVDWGEFHEWVSCTDEQARHADFQCCGQSYIEMYLLDPSQQQRLEHIKMRIDNMLATEQINDWYWIDAIQMAMPIFMQLGTITGDDRYYERAFEMYTYTRNKHGGSKKNGGSPLFNTETGLWYRDYQFDPPYKDKTEADKDCYWSRGNGWVYMALARNMQFSDETEPHRADYCADFLLMSEALKNCQRADGYWSVSLAAPSNFGAAGSEGPEISGTSLFVGGMAYGIRAGLLDRDAYLPAVVQGWEAMKAAVHPDGFVGYMQGTGSKPEDGGPITYDSRPDFEDFGIGCWLWGAAEVHALARQLEQGDSGVELIVADPFQGSEHFSAGENNCGSNSYYDLYGRVVVRPLPGNLYIRNHNLVRY